MLKVKAFNSKTGAKNVAKNVFKLKEPCAISYVVFKNATTTKSIYQRL